MGGEPSRQALAISDSASIFAPAWQRPLMLEYLLSLSPSDNPVLLYVGTAKGDSAYRIAQFYQLAERVRCRPKVLSFFELDSGDPRRFFVGADIIFIDGGSTRNLLAIMREWDALPALQRAYDSGVIVAGASAGASVLFDWCITDSARQELAPLEGIGMLSGSICVHHGVRPDRETTFSSFLEGGDAAFPAYGLEDGVALHFLNEKLLHIIGVMPGQQCHLIPGRGAPSEAMEIDSKLAITGSEIKR